MARASRHPLAFIRQRIASLDPRTIDELYGLEPVFEPGAPSASLGEYVELQCPWCGEVYGSQVDLTDASRCYIEDCQVCCRPIEVRISVDDDGGLEDVRTARVD